MLIETFIWRSFALAHFVGLQLNYSNYIISTDLVQSNRNLPLFARRFSVWASSVLFLNFCLRLFVYEMDATMWMKWRTAKMYNNSDRFHSSNARE